MKEVRGSLTIEAALMIPLALLLFMMAMNGGIQLYQECRDTAISISEEEKMDVINMFYNWKMLEDVGKDED